MLRRRWDSNPQAAINRDRLAICSRNHLSTPPNIHILPLITGEVN